MTKEEAIKELSYIADEMPSMECGDWKEAIYMAIKALEQEPFMNKPCVAHQVCHEDKVKVLDKIRAEIEQTFLDNGAIRAGMSTALNIIDKYRESEESDANSN